MAAAQKAKAIEVEWKTATNADVERYEVEKSINGPSTKAASVLTKDGLQMSILAQMPHRLKRPNLYRSKSVDKPGEITYGKGVNVKQNLNGAAGVNVYPNPVAGGSLTWQLPALEKDVYAARLINAGGQRVMKQTIHHAGGSALQTIGLNTGLPKGIYTLQPAGRNTALTKQISRQ